MAERTSTIAIELDASRAVVEVGGHAVPGTARTLATLLGGLMDDGEVDLVVGLGGLAALDDSVREVIVEVAARMGRVGGCLTVRAAPATAELLDLGMGAHVRYEPDAGTPAALGLEQRTIDHPPPVPDQAVRSGHEVPRVGSKLTDDAIDTAVRRVAVLAAEVVDGARGASVTLARAGHLMTAASSNDTVLSMDRHQYETGQGPCLAAATVGRWFHTPSLRHEDRWPAFTPLAMRDGIASILSTPIIVAGRSIGALNIYSTRETAFGTGQQQLAAALAAHAAGVLADIDATDHGDERARRALRSRATIALAQGIVVERSRVTASQALALLLRSAQASGAAVVDHAQRIIDSSGPDTPQEAADPHLDELS